MKPFFVFIFTLTFIISANAGSNESYKPSKVTTADLNMNVYDKDSSAGAVILYDIGAVELKFVQGKQGFEYSYQRKTRIKILNSNQLDQANQEVYLFIGEEDRETIGSLKGTTYNLENGKIEENSLKKDAIFKESIENKYATTRFAMPNVKVGSIIEYEYTIRSPFIHSLPNWKFQHEIPTIVSIYTVDIPEFFTYRINMKGYLNIASPSTTFRDVTSSYTHRELDVKGSETGASKSYNVDLDYVMTARKWTAKDVPALTEEPYVSCIDNYISQIDFELAKTKYPNSPEKVYSLTWEGVIKQLYESDDVSRQLGKSSAYMTDVFKLISETATNNLDKMTMAHSFIKNKMTWNQNNSKFSKDGLKDAFQKGNGNSADIIPK